MPRSPSPSPPLDDPHLQRSTKRRVSYFYDPDVGGFAYPYQHPMKPHRMRMAHALIGAYGMLGQMQVVRPKRADELQLTRFHTDEYIEFLKSITAENYMEWTANKKFCQTDDCPPWDGLFDFATLTAGSSISAAHSLVTGHSDIAIAWAGGLHHAKRAEASGFCYVNDIVLGILELLRAHARVLYVDIDIHHGDGVEEAFYTTDRVMTCSFHKFGDFFPGTGTVGDVGKGRGKGYAVNVPLRDGLSDEKFVETFKSVIGRVMEWYRPGAVVLQGGADSLAGDKLGVFNLSMNGHAACAAYMRGFNVPLLMVGGGGYTVKNVSRTWTYETAVAIGCTDQISPDLPDNEYLEWFGPRYKLEVLCNNQEDYNTTEYVEGIKQKIWENMRDLPHAPSAGVSELQEGRRTWRGDDWEEEDSDMDDLDKRISRAPFSLIIKYHISDG
ncbi:class I RPD3 type histone deacetylase protein [Calocera cornea HHB12733]|uniref:Histone deacetylase n=1 Tax=Calocera cornea HHB12733 TaxID=1353952 RepID=A0A165INF3_9BASI|nr:class I RPD3 type histone deacetylase protein [Calocera cornea HHB12733]